MSFSSIVEQDRKSREEWQRRIRLRTQRRRCVVHDVFNHVQRKIHRGEDVTKWLRTMKRLTEVRL